MLSIQIKGHLKKIALKIIYFSSDNGNVKRNFYNFSGIKKSFFLKAAAAFLLLFILLNNSFAYVCKYKEDYYKLYHIQYAQTSDDCLENIYWLEKAVEAPFANPLYAMAKIKTEEEWEKYRYMFMMHLNLKLVEQHLRLGRIYDKQVAYFYDAPWKDEYLRNLEKAKSFYQAGYYYWEEAKLWAEKASTTNFNFLWITDQQSWEDERNRIVTEELDYKKTLDREIKRVDEVIESYVAMDSKNY